MVANVRANGEQQAFWEAQEAFFYLWLAFLIDRVTLLTQQSAFAIG
jgi:hypothetical protein